MTATERHDHFQDVYVREADRYDRMVSREDYEGHLLPAISGIQPLDRASTRVVEFGAGTGRLTRLLAPHVHTIHAFDQSRQMLEIARATLKAKHPTARWTLAAGDNRRMPVPNNQANLTIAGWSFGHFTGWYPGSWREQLSGALGEMRRLTRPGGTLLIIETLGTGSETPAPPTPVLAEYYHLLEMDYGFTRHWIRTDLRFESVAEADELTRFFFGDAFADRLVATGQTVVPECTGLWWRRV